MGRGFRLALPSLMGALFLLLSLHCAAQTVRSPTEDVFNLGCNTPTSSSTINASVSTSGNASVKTTITNTVTRDGVTTSRTATLSSSGGSTSLIIGGVPFEVPGTDRDIDICAISESNQDRSADRPSGAWDFIVDGRVPKSPQSIWNTLENFGNVLAWGFQGIASKVRALDEGNKQFIVDLNSGETIEFTVEETDEENRYHIITLSNHSPGVFEGFSVSGSTLYFWIARGQARKLSVLELGFEGAVVPASLSGAAEVFVESLFQEMLASIEIRFGESCDLLQFDRTIEGDCNNLKDPRRGAANHALKRLPLHDPTFGDGLSTPGGALHISPRSISNAVFAESLGIEFQMQQVNALAGNCFTKTSVGATRWEVCMFGAATVMRGRQVSARLDWLGPEEHESGSVHFKWGAGSACELSVAFRCSGEEELIISDTTNGFEFVGPQCGRRVGWLYSPRACRIDTGEDGVGASAVSLTDMFWTVGQFLDHDLDLTPESQLADEKQPGFKNSRVLAENEEFPIDVPEDEFYFINNKTLEFKRSEFIKVDEPAEGPVEYVNQHSAFLDLGQVYGADFLRANALREFKDGKLKLGPGEMLPKNKLLGNGALGAKLSNAPDAQDKFFVAGDIRANEQATLLCMHILWAREHNRVCSELKQIFADYDDKQLFATARAIVISEWQSIIYTEWLPMLLGPDAVPKEDYQYDEDVDPNIMAFFSTVAFRFGHSLVPATLWMMGSGPQPTVTPMPLREVFFKPEVVEQYGIDVFLRGATKHVARKLDSSVNDELRNFLFTEDEDSPHMDLVSLNIQRGRDMGLPKYNDAREAYGLTRYTNFSQITSNEFVWGSIAKVYEGNIDDVDAFVGGLAEDKFAGSLLGELFYTAIVDQFTRLRDGDRFFYSAIDWNDEILDKYPRLQRILNDNVKLADIIERNTGITHEEMNSDGRDTVLSEA